MIARTVNTVEEIPEELKPYYIQGGDGKFTLDIEDKEGGELRGQIGQVTAQRDESNKKLKEATERLAPFIALSREPQAIAEDLNRIAALEIQAQGSSDPAETEKKISEEVDRRLAGMKRDFENQITGLGNQVDSLTTENTDMRVVANRTVIRDALQSALGTVASPQQGAFEDILRRAEGEFKVNPETKELEAFDPNGNRKFAKNGKAPLAMDEWVEGLHETSGYLFVPSSGGGAGGSSNSKNQPAAGGSGPIVDVSDPSNFGKNLKAVAEGISRNVN